MNLRKIIKNRKTKPIFHHYGKITDASVQLLKDSFVTVPESLLNAKELRDEYDVDKQRDDYDKHLSKYHQHDIQYKLDEDENIEENYKHLDEKFRTVYDELSYMLGSPIYRLRYATIEEDDSLGFHIDQPTFDRFVMVVEGEHLAIIKTDDDTYSQLMKPGEVWYMNTNWKHKVVNTSEKKRIALLGCFTKNTS